MKSSVNSWTFSQTLGNVSEAPRQTRYPDTCRSLSLSLYLCFSIYIYIYIYMYLCIYYTGICIYKYFESIYIYMVGGYPPPPFPRGGLDFGPFGWIRSNAPEWTRKNEQTKQNKQKERKKVRERDRWIGRKTEETKKETMKEINSETTFIHLSFSLPYRDKPIDSLTWYGIQSLT